MTQCRATTKRGSRCRRDAGADSRYCSMHEPAIEIEVEEVEPEGSGSWDEELSDSAKVVLGLAIAGIVVVSYLFRGRF